MSDYYRKMYYLLFNSITDALKLIQKDDVLSAQHILTEAQQQAEEIYLTYSSEK